MTNIQILTPEDWRDYELLDSGDGQKLERWGQYLTIRPDPRTIWKKSAPDMWKKAQGIFVEDWDFMTPPPKPWQISFNKIKFVLKPTEFKHVGVFPEQAVNWKWLADRSQGAKVLNLFAYTGGATMAAALAGAHVTHLDASRPAMMWASENAAIAGIAKDRIRWIQDDALKFVKREISRGIKYDGIIMDPPRFGRGMKGEVWKLMERLPELVYAAREIISETPRFFLINAYTADISSVVLENLLAGVVKDWGGNLESGELGLKESMGGRILPAGIFVRWSISSGK